MSSPLDERDSRHCVWKSLKYKKSISLHNLSRGRYVCQKSAKFAFAKNEIRILFHSKFRFSSTHLMTKCQVEFLGRIFSVLFKSQSYKIFIVKVSFTAIIASKYFCTTSFNIVYTSYNYCSKNKNHFFE